MRLADTLSTLPEIDPRFTPAAVAAYERYLRGKRNKERLSLRGKTSSSDSQRMKVYRAEWAFAAAYGLGNSFATLKDAQAYANKITKSKTWKKVQSPAYGKTRKHIPLELKNNNNSYIGRVAGCIGRSWGGKIDLTREGMNELVLLHELAHEAGYTDHDVGFRQAFVKLVSRFMGREAGKLLHKKYRIQKLRMTMPNTEPLMPEAWIETYERAMNAQSKRKVYRIRANLESIW